MSSAARLLRDHEDKRHAPNVAHVTHAPARQFSAMARVLTCGSVDDGKSTLIGRLLWDASELPLDTRAMIAASAAADGIPDVSLLLDGLEAERAQGITIDIAWRYFDVADRRYVFIDCPGHEQYTRNMATGASQADIAIMLVDARHGIKHQTRRHMAILQLVGIRHVVLAINKMDLAHWSKSTFEAIAHEFAALSRTAHFERAVAIPVAARLGDNIAVKSHNLPWYDGPTLLDVLESTPIQRHAPDRPFRFPVQNSVRASQEFRGLAGTVASGAVSVGDPIVEVLSGQSARITRIATFDGDRATATAGDAVTLTIDTDLDISRGGMLTTPEVAAVATRDIDVSLVWLADTRPPNAGLLLRSATDLVPVANFRVTSILDLKTLQRQSATTCGPNDLVDARIALGRPVAFDTFADCPMTGQFLLIDALTGATVAGGVITATKADVEREPNGVFRLTRSMLLATVCADLHNPGRANQEFQRRATEVAFLLSAAGVRVELDLSETDAGEEGGSGI